ncbi:helix-turn-helix transcriptional regulator [Candidatus Coxiella mudrowiae]
MLGKTHKEIVQECNISRHTVEKHLELIKHKFVFKSSLK